MLNRCTSRVASFGLVGGCKEGGSKIPYLVVAFLVLWFVFGDPKTTIANWFWPEAPAPWESVDGFYYPDSSNLLISESALGLANVEACRTWARASANRINDLAFDQSTYECGVGFKEFAGKLRIYRLTVR